MKVLAIGLPGAVPELLFGDERLVNVRGLMENGNFGTLAGVIPSTPTAAWAAWNTGCDPGALGLAASKEAETGIRLPSLPQHTATLAERLAEADRHAWFLGPDSSIRSATSPDALLSFVTSATQQQTEAPTAALRQQVAPQTAELAALWSAERPCDADEASQMQERYFGLLEQLAACPEWDYLQAVDHGFERVQQSFWRHLDPEHPRHADGELGETILQYYRGFDRRLGRVLETLTEETAVVLVSPYGTQSVQAGFALNDWLIREGYLVLHNPPSPGTPLDESAIDWAKTKAWCCGSAIRLNIQDREPRGTVPKSEGLALRAEISERLRQFADSQHARIGFDVLEPEHLYAVIEPPIPDLIVSAADLPYAILDSVGHESLVLESGCAAIPDATVTGQGLFVLAAPDHPPRGEMQDVQLLDCFPTLLELCGLAPDGQSQGRSLRLDGPDTSSVPESLSAEALIRERLRGLGYV